MPSRAGSDDFEMDEPSWGIGSLVVTKLFNPEGDVSTAPYRHSVVNLMY